MSEADEDDELLEDDLNDSAITHFNESPYCKSTCSYSNHSGPTSAVIWLCYYIEHKLTIISLPIFKILTSEVFLRIFGRI